MRAFLKTLTCLCALASITACTAAEPKIAARNPLPEADPKPEISRAVSCLAEAVYFEARGTGDVGQAAVAHVVVNRAESPKFPDTVCGVVADGCQFSYRCDGNPETLADPGARANAHRTAEQVIAGAAPDITKGALFFHADEMAPGWFNTRPRVGTFGGNVFYR